MAFNALAAAVNVFPLSETSFFGVPLRAANLLKAFWDLESFEIEAKETSLNAQFQSMVRFVDGHYEVNLPWKNPDVILSDNYNLCLRVY